MNNMAVNEEPVRNQYDSLFTCMLSERENIIDIYNALNGTDYRSDDVDFEINTLKDVLYIHHKNDVSFILNMHLMLFEHQSTFNPNMPLRGLFYFSALYQNLLEGKSARIYGSKLIKIPTPRYIIFYNGDSELPERMMMHLSDAYEMPGDFDLQVTANVININEGFNSELLRKSEVLRAFSLYSAKIKRYNKTMEFRDAVSRSIDECINEGIMSDFFNRRRLEVEHVILTEFDEEDYREMIREEERLKFEEERREYESKEKDYETEIARLKARVKALEQQK